jgi:hypothetical protein
VRGVVDTLMRVVEALDRAGIELIGDNMPSGGSGRGVRLKEPGSGTMQVRASGARVRAEELP